MSDDTISRQEAIEAVEVPSRWGSLVHCSECVRKSKCKFYDTQGNDGYCRYGQSEDGQMNPQRWDDE